jgi:hypothetical protein
MALVLSDRVQETGTVATGTGSVALAGAVNGYQSFTAGVGNGNTCYYTIYDGTAFTWEVGIGTFTTGPTTLARTTVLSSSNSGSLVSFSTVNTLLVWVDYPSERAVYGSGTTIVAPTGALLPVANGGTGLSSLTANYIPYGNGTSAFQSSSNFTYNGTLLTATSAVLGATTLPTTANNIPLAIQSSGGGPITKVYSNTTATQAATVGLQVSTYGTSRYSGYEVGSGGGGLWVNSTGGATYLSSAGTAPIYFGTFNSDPFENTGSTFTTTMALSSGGAITSATWNGSTVGVAYGGTGATTLTANGVLYGSGTGAIGATSVGTTGQFLIGNTGAAPSWGTLSSSAVTTFSAGTTGLTPSSATSGAITLAGTLVVGNGGTGLTTLTAGYIPYGNGTSAFQSSSSLTFSTAQGLTVNQASFASGNTNPYSAFRTTGSFGGGGYQLVDTNVAGIYTQDSGATLVFYTGMSSSDTPAGKSKLWINSTGAVAFGTSQSAYGTSGQALISQGNSSPAWGTLGVAGGGTGLTTLAANYIPYGNGTAAFQSSVNLQFNNSVLGVGVGTISSWSGANGLELAGGSFFSTGTVSCYLAQNSYFNGTNYIAKITAGATAYNPYNGTHQFSTAPSVTAGATQTFTNVLTINNSGALGFGSSPSYGTSGQALISGGTSATPSWGTLGVAGGGTGLTTLAAGYIPYGNGTGALSSSSSFLYDGTNFLVGTSSALSGGDSKAYINGSIYSVAGNAGLAANTVQGYTVYNQYYNGTSNAARNAGYGGRWTFDLTNGYLSWTGYATTTAGGVPTGTEYFRITSAGGISFGSSGTAYGTSGQILTSAGNAPPTWATLTSGTGISVSGTTINATGATINSQTTGYTLVAGDAGKAISITTGGVTIPNSVMSAGNIITIYNNSGSSQTITQGTGVTLQWAGQASSTTGNRTLGLYGIATIIYITASNAVISGAGLT